MANTQQHLDQWEHNRRLLSTLPAGYPDWIVTVSFYIALHAVDALLVYDGVTRINSHASRNDVLMTTRRYQHIWDRYQQLHDLSRKVRYLADPARWVPPARIEQDVLKRYLYPVEESAFRLMGRPAAPPLSVQRPVPPAPSSPPPT